MMLSSKHDESDGIKTFEVYSSYITLASNSAFFFKKNCDRQKGRFFIAKIHIIAIDNVIFEFYNHHFAVFCD